MTTNQFIDQLVNDLEIKKKSIFITGSAGVGKTTIVKALYERLMASGKHNVALTSTTGISALQFEGITIHKFCGINVQTSPNYINFLKHTFQFASLKKRFAKFDIIIIDEISMFRADQFILIDRVLRTGTGIDKPFGGKLIIFTGDFYQIPPVVLSWEIEKNQWIFKTNIWNNSNIVCYELTHIFRQIDPTFSNLLNNVRTGNIDKSTIQFIKNCEKNKPLPFDTYFFATNEECDAFNQKKLNEVNAKSHIYQAVVSGKRKQANKDAIIRDCIAKETLELKVGVKVIIIYNDTNKKPRFVNGSKAEVISLGKDTVSVKLIENDLIVKLKRHTWKKVDIYGHTKAKLKQIPLILAYALTIHKSQGMTLDGAIIDCKNIFASGQLYVAMSRVKTMERLCLKNFDLSKIITCQEVKKYYQSKDIQKIILS